MTTDNPFFDCPTDHQARILPDDVLSDCIVVIHDFKLRKIVKQIRTESPKQHKVKIINQERWFCLPEMKGEDLPRYVRDGAHGTGYKTFNSLFAAVGYYRTKLDQSPTPENKTNL